MRVSYLIFTMFAFLVSAVLCPVVIQLAKKFGWYDVENPRKMHKGKIPRLGGVAVIFSIFLTSVIAANFVDVVQIKYYLSVLIGASVIFVSCLIDDFISIRARYKVLFQFLAAFIVSFSPLSLNNVFSFALPWWLDDLMIFCWILLLVNAYNLIDGVDWLCSGLAVLSILFYAFIYYKAGSPVCCYLLIFSGAILGFMVWNRPVAKIFLGDCGSEMIGFIIAVIPFMPTEIRSFEYNKVLVCLLVSAIPTIDVFAAVWRRLRDGKSIFCADNKHIHHKLFNIGFSVKSILVFLYTIQLLISGVCILALFITVEHGLTLMAITYIFALLFFGAIHFINRSVNRKFLGALQTKDNSRDSEQNDDSL